MPSFETGERAVKDSPFTCNPMNHNAIRMKRNKWNERKETLVGWNGQVQWSGQVSRYNIYRKERMDMEFESPYDC
ncbi:MAG: hypothetical protein IJ467_06475 [Bacteroidaceae bacterium]|nr:hypothetical protein [Bacteroidaceae bacterium]